MTKYEDISKQVTFIKELSERLYKDVLKSLKSHNVYNGTIHNGYRLKQDIIRIRRELLSLEKQVYGEYTKD